MVIKTILVIKWAKGGICRNIGNEIETNREKGGDVKMYKKIISGFLLIILVFTLFTPKLSVNAMTVDGFNVIKGDILVTNATSSNGFTGHAAIANGDYHILDAPGIGQTTRQMATDQWIHSYAAGGWVKVYRVPSQYAYVATAAGTWADTHYYSTSGSSVQNIFPSYSITGNVYSTDPTYCSKIPYQAYYYGSGSLPFVLDYSDPWHRNQTIIYPYLLIDQFNSPYKPVLVHQYGS